MRRQCSGVKVMTDDASTKASWGSLQGIRMPLQQRDSYATMPLATNIHDSLVELATSPIRFQPL